MKKELFIYLTNNSELDLVGGGYPIAPPLDINFPFYLLPGKEAKSELDDSFTPVAILIRDEISIELFRSEILKIADKYNVIYLAYHTLGLRDGKEIDGVSNKIISRFIQHFPPDPIYSTALDFIKSTTNEEIQKAIQSARNEFTKDDNLNHYLKSFNVDPF